MIARGARSGEALTECACMVNSLNGLDGPTYLKGDGVGDTTSGWYLRTHLRTLMSKRLVNGDEVW